MQRSPSYGRLNPRTGVTAAPRSTEGTSAVEESLVSSVLVIEPILKPILGQGTALVGMKSFEVADLLGIRLGTLV